MTPKAKSDGWIVAASPPGLFCDACSVRCMPVFRPFDPADLAFMKRMVIARRSFSPEADILRADETGGGPYTLWDGWAYLYRELATTEGTPRRQIMEILLPGDVFGLGVALTGRVGSSVRALTASTICAHDPRVFDSIFTERPTLVRRLMETLVGDTERANARLAIVGQGSGAERVGHLALDIWHRLIARDASLQAARPARFPFPLQRRHLAAALGMSGTHATRSLADLHAAGLMQMEGDGLAINDPEGLAAFCGYVPAPDETGQRLIL